VAAREANEGGSAVAAREKLKIKKTTIHDKM
jgi:hypothetical protein